MKSITKYIFIFLLLIGSFSCDFDLETYQSIPTEEAFSSIEDVQNGMIGAYYALGTYRFLGNYAIAIGDLATDVSVASASTGHGVVINRYNFSDTDSWLRDSWEYGYKVIDRCIRTINGANELIANTSNLRDDEIALLNAYKAQCYALRALSNFYLVNLFALPYQAGGNNTQLGLPLLKDEPLEPFVNINRSTVEETYALILSDITTAKEYIDKAEDAMADFNQFYMNEAAVYALDARVKLFMGNYTGAKESAQIAIDLRGSADIEDLSKYVSMWSDIAITPEDIFTIPKTTDDNLSANALNTLYGSYGSTLSPSIINLFGPNDIRRELIDEEDDFRPLKFDGIPSAQAVSNIPILRKSEMYLIIAESEARFGNITASQNALFKVAYRNADITSADQLPSTTDALLDFISEENVREFFEEGHRFYNARRTGELINPNVTGVNSFDISKFVYPIPAYEINAGFMTEQNPGWQNAVPSAG